MRRLTSKAALLLLVLVAGGCGASGPPDAEVSKSIRTLVTERSVRGERLLEPKAVAAYYKGRGAKRAWKGGDAEQIVKAIHGIERDGLDPSIYHLQVLENSLADRKDATAESEAEMDLLLTDAVAAMVDHMRYGRVHPSSLDRRWNVDPRDDAPPLEQEVAKVVDASSVEAALEAERPKHFIYDGLVGALAHLREIATKGGWGTVPAGKAIKPGATDARIPAVRKRLAASGELAAGADATSTQYDGELQKAVELFQARHRLDPDGIIDPATVAAMNVSAEERANQVRVESRARALGAERTRRQLPARQSTRVQDLFDSRRAERVGVAHAGRRGGRRVADAYIPRRHAHRGLQSRLDRAAEHPRQGGGRGHAREPELPGGEGSRAHRPEQRAGRPWERRSGRGELPLHGSATAGRGQRARPREIPVPQQVFDLSARHAEQAKLRG